ncbi:hypothetical protein FDP08_00560 [Marinobacter panjinensis]|uniref:Uncharacterized protein n=1 Tax=Marinobacter panjinensis TaxID=2576384 RepID=A0A4U6QZY5_9GAMM|nr:hypothetical protein [Marinobacter panjinensis]MCR8915428.1 hypothetical protein [Marinobacter panjinensis]TKV66683.1 hypothetical protein FDP08_00560 [Marinobacter panjinensis]
MKKNFLVLMLMVAASANAWAQEVDYDKRNLHIFCASHLALLSDSLTEKGDDYKALVFLSDTHGDEARKMGATETHFSDVTRYLKTVRNNNKGKWDRLTSRSRDVCLPNS